MSSRTIQLCRASSTQFLASLAFCLFWANAAPADDDCQPPVESTFTVTLPKVTNPPDPHGWGGLPLVWGSLNSQVASSDSIEVPNGRPIYALIVSGHSRNGDLDELLVYRFARHLMNQGAYVHWAWWNNLLAPYMERPLHHQSSHPGASSALDFATEGQAVNKAVPGENYQFLSDATILIQAIRANNPSAIIILVGHSMGGRSIVDLALQTDVVIDLVAPIDPVANRTYPWLAPVYQNQYHFNWTRWRATRANFAGYQSMIHTIGQGCNKSGTWVKNYDQAAAGASTLCVPKVHIHNPPALTFGSNVINLHHRWQHEYRFPFDYSDAYTFGHATPPGGTNSQSSLAMQGWTCGLFKSNPCPEENGWPQIGVFPAKYECCPPSEGISWPEDGHGEIIGNRGDFPNLVPLGTRVRTSPNCGSNCSGLNWPAYNGSWSSPHNANRMAKLKELEYPSKWAWVPSSNPDTDPWPERPFNAGLCKVSAGLIGKFNNMNKPPIAHAGMNRVILCDGCDSTYVTLNGSGSSDPDDDPLTYSWKWSSGSATGMIAHMNLPPGSHCITLTVKDPSGHTDVDVVNITVSDSAGVAPFTSAADDWKSVAGEYVAYAFDEFFPGVASGGGCLLDLPIEPMTIGLDGGLLTVSAFDSGSPYCAITDSGSAAAHSDVRIDNQNSVAVFEFDPPVTSFYTYYGSLASGHSATMDLYSAPNGAYVGSITTPPSTTFVLAAGHGFTSSVPIERIEFTATEPGSVMVGAFTGLKPDEPSLGTIDLGDYAGPGGSGIIQLDFACTFGEAPALCPADLTGNGSVGVPDLLTLLAAWGPCSDSSNCPADLTGSAVVGVPDLLALLSNWGPCP